MNTCQPVCRRVRVDTLLDNHPIRDHILLYTISESLKIITPLPPYVNAFFTRFHRTVISLMKWSITQRKIAREGDFRKRRTGCPLLPARPVEYHISISLVKSDWKLQQKTALPRQPPFQSSRPCFALSARALIKIDFRDPLPKFRLSWSCGLISIYPQPFLLLRIKNFIIFFCYDRSTAVCRSRQGRISVFLPVFR